MLGVILNWADHRLEEFFLKSRYHPQIETTWQATTNDAAVSCFVAVILNLSEVGLGDTAEKTTVKFHISHYL